MSTARYSGYAACPKCGDAMHVEKTHNGVCLVWHGIHCGYGQTGFSDEEVVDRPEDLVIPKELTDELRIKKLRAAIESAVHRLQDLQYEQDPVICGLITDLNQTLVGTN